VKNSAQRKCPPITPLSLAVPFQYPSARAKASGSKNAGFCWLEDSLLALQHSVWGDPLYQQRRVSFRPTEISPFWSVCEGQASLCAEGFDCSRLMSSPPPWRVQRLTTLPYRPFFFDTIDIFEISPDPPPSRSNAPFLFETEDFRWTLPCTLYPTCTRGSPYRRRTRPGFRICISGAQADSVHPFTVRLPAVQ